MRMRRMFGLALLVLAIMAAGVVPAIASLRKPAAPAVIPATELTVLIDTGVIESEDGQTTISAIAITRAGN